MERAERAVLMVQVVLQEHQEHPVQLELAVLQEQVVPQVLMVQVVARVNQVFQLMDSVQNTLQLQQQQTQVQVNLDLTPLTQH